MGFQKGIGGCSQKACTSEGGWLPVWVSVGSEVAGGDTPERW